MTRYPDIHHRPDGSIDIDHYLRAAAEERTKVRLRVHARFDEAMAAIVLGAKNLLSRRPGLRLRPPHPPDADLLHGSFKLESSRHDPPLFPT